MLHACAYVLSEFSSTSLRLSVPCCVCPTEIECVAAPLTLLLFPPPVFVGRCGGVQSVLPCSCTGFVPSVIDSEKRPVWRSGLAVVLTRIRYGPRLGKVRDTRDEQPGPPSSLMIDWSRSEPRMISTGSKSSDDRSIV